MNPGEQVRITTNNGLVFEGLVLPGDGLTIKLRDGYNVGIDQRNVSKSEVIGSHESKESVVSEVVKDDSLPKVLILHTGGTIASKVDYETGGVSHLFKPEEIIAMYPELQQVANVDAKFVANMWSDDMRFSHYNIIAKAVEEAVRESKYVGIIITMGTDTLHYTAAALHYALRNVPIPVVISGSQRSSDRGSSDGVNNLLGACSFIATTGMAGVFVAMHEGSGDDLVSIMSGVNCRKMHTSRRDAFKSINIPPLARVTNEHVEILSEIPKPNGDFQVELFNESLRIGMCYIHPNFFPEELEVFNNFDGLVVLATGLGQMPINDIDDNTKSHANIRKAVEDLAKKIPVVDCSQCIHGRVSLQVYSPARNLQDMGVLGHNSALSPESTFIKLAWLLSTNRDPKSITDDHGENLSRTEEQSYD